jgi:hypothetical protein
LTNEQVKLLCIAAGTSHKLAHEDTQNLLELQKKRLGKYEYWSNRRCLSSPYR